MEVTSEEGRDKWEGDRYLRKKKTKKTKCPTIPFSKVRFVQSRTFGYKWEIGTSPKKNRMPCDFISRSQNFPVRTFQSE
jgi:hypothetical protein